MSFLSNFIVLRYKYRQFCKLLLTGVILLLCELCALIGVMQLLSHLF